MEHKLYSLISKDISDIARLALHNKDGGKTMVSSKQYFVVEIMYPIFEILSKLEDLNCSLYFIKHYPINKTLRRDITREKYIIYHLEHYFISQISLFDRLLHFCNMIYEIGLDDRHVTYDIIKNNSKVGNDYKITLKKLYNNLEKSEVRILQNKIKHKEKLRDKEMEEASFFEMASIAAGSNKNEEDEELLQKATSRAYKRYLIMKNEKMIEEMKALEGFVMDLFDVAYPIIEGKYKKYKD
jgi:hypothetical protein